MFAHGAQKVLGWYGGQGPSMLTGMSQGTGIPEVLLYISAYVEFLGGIALVFGLFTRFFSIAILVNMLVALFVVHAKAGFFNPAGFEFPLALITMALAETVLGPGEYSLDWLFFYRPQDYETTERVTRVRDTRKASFGGGGTTIATGTSLGKTPRTV